MGAVAYRVGEGDDVHRPTRVLVIDDDSFDRKRLRRLIQRSQVDNIDLTEAVSIEHFKSLLRYTSYDLVLIDFGLSDGTGFDALDALRGCQRNLSSFAVMISGRDDEGLRDACLLKGCDAFLTKADLDVAVTRDILKKLVSKSLDAEIVDPVAARSSLTYWAHRAEIRARRDVALGRKENRVVLKQLLGLQPSQDPTPKGARRGVPDHAALALRLFIQDFLAADEFEF